MQSADTTIPIYGLELPDWVVNFCYDFGGISLSPINQSQLLELCKQSPVKHLIVYEQFVTDHTEILMNLLQQQRVESLTIYKNHPFAFTDALMDRLNTVAMTADINIIVNGYYNNVYNNIKIYSIDTWEHSISHSFVLLLSRLLHKKRQPTKMFSIQTVFKDDFRKTVGTYLRESALWTDFFSLPLTDSSTPLYKKVADVLQHFKQQYGDGQHISALTSFGNGLPNFKMYEQTFCELILETRNSGSWHFTEKTFRPIALGIPVVHLGHKPMYDRLLANGYRLYDNGFYQQWHAECALEKKLPYLENFLTHINSNTAVQEQMEQIAQHNYQQFWNQRKHYHYTHIQQIFDSIAGENTLTHKIYKQLDF
jgi:hypothetical protein